jgi:hypothetical protein
MTTILDKAKRSQVISNNITLTLSDKSFTLLSEKIVRINLFGINGNV